MEELLERARARKLDRVGAGYAVATWVLVQAASIALPAFQAPGWSMRWLIVAALIGFPLSLGAAWVAGARRDKASLKPLAARDWLLFGLIALVAVLLVLQLAEHFPFGRTPSLPVKRPPSSIAVLPFANLSGDPKQVYFSEGIADQLIGELAKMPKLQVAARTSSFAFEGKKADVRSIAKALNVRNIVEGSVREAEGRVRIAAELIDAKTGFQIWSDSYDRKLSGILSLQTDIANAIAGALIPKLLGRAKTPAHRKPIDPQAYKDYLQGQFYYAKRSAGGIARAIAFFKQAVQRAPDYTDAYAALAGAYSTQAMNMGVMNTIAPAERWTNEALRRDPNNVTAIGAHSAIMILRWRWLAAAADIKRLDAMHVHSAQGWHIRATYFGYMELSDLALRAIRHAVQLNPLSYIDRRNLALYEFLSGDKAGALKTAMAAYDMERGNPDGAQLVCEIRVKRGEMAEAQAIERRLTAQARAKEPLGAAAACAYFIAVAEKNRAELEKLADEAVTAFKSGNETATDIGTVYAQAGDYDKAIEWFRRAYARREPWLLLVPYTQPELAPLFKDPRWKALRKKTAILGWENARAAVAAKFRTGG